MILLRQYRGLPKGFRVRGYPYYPFRMYLCLASLLKFLLMYRMSFPNFLKLKIEVQAYRLNLYQFLRPIANLVRLRLRMTQCRLMLKSLCRQVPKFSELQP